VIHILIYNAVIGQKQTEKELTYKRSKQRGWQSNHYSEHF